MKRAARWVFDALALASLLLFVATVVLSVNSYRTRMEIHFSDAHPTKDGGAIVKYSASVADAVLAAGGSVRNVPVPEGTTVWHFLDDPPGFTVQKLVRQRPLVRPAGLDIPLWGAAGGLAILPASAFFVAWRRRCEMRRRVRGSLCRHCGYDLRASADRCPECGAAIGQAPATAAPLWRRWAATGVVWLLAFGIGWALVRRDLRHGVVAWRQAHADELADELCWAAARGDCANIERQLARGADINRDGNEGLLVTGGHGEQSPLRQAIEHHHMAAVRLLLDRGAKAEGLDYAVEHQDLELAKLLLEHGASTDEDAEYDRMPLFLAIDREMGHAQVEMVQLLLAHGASVNAPDEQGRTPLWAAAEWHDLPVAEMLVQHGADVNAQWRGEPPLFEAAGRDDVPLTKLLLNHGASVRDGAGNTPLWYPQSMELAKLLLAHGAAASMPLEFHIIVANPQSEAPDMVARLEPQGGQPAQGLAPHPGDTMRWYEMGDDWYFSRRYNGKSYGLFWMTPDKSMMHAPGRPGWSVIDAYRQTDPGGRVVVGFKLDARGGALLGDLTERNLGKPLAVMLDGGVMSAELINARISDRGELGGRYAEYSATEMYVLEQVLKANGTDSRAQPSEPAHR